VDISNGILQISHDTALGAGFAQSATSGRTTIGTAVANTGRLELAGDSADDSLTISERIFATGRSAAFDSAATHILNIHGTNTLSGPIEAQSITNAGAFVIEAADDGLGAADQLTISGTITQRRDTSAGGSNSLVLRGNGKGVVSGGILNGSTATQSWNVRKLDTGTWTLDSAANNYTGVTHVAAGKLVLGATGSIASSATIQVDADATLDVSSQPTFTVGAVTPQVIKGAGSVVGNTTIATGSELEVDYVGGVANKLSFSGALNIANSTVDFDDLGVGGLNTGPHIFATYGSLSGTFGTVFDLPTGYSINYNYLGNQIALVESVTIGGDYNSDGAVNAADYVVWRKNPEAFGGTPGGYNTWRANFGAGGGSGSGLGGAAGVPEPTAGALMLLALGFVTSATRSKRHR
jgi:autotransporter-associated beta strand protein